MLIDLGEFTSKRVGWVVFPSPLSLALFPQTWSLQSTCFDTWFVFMYVDRELLLIRTSWAELVVEAREMSYELKTMSERMGWLQL